MEFSRRSYCLILEGVESAIGFTYGLITNRRCGWSALSTRDRCFSWLRCETTNSSTSTTTWHSWSRNLTATGRHTRTTSECRKKSTVDWRSTTAAFGQSGRQHLQMGYEGFNLARTSTIALMRNKHPKQFKRRWATQGWKRRSKYSRTGKTKFPLPH